MNVKIHKKDCKLISEIYKKSNKIMISKVSLRTQTWWNILKSINTIHRHNRIKQKNMIISTDV